MAPARIYESARPIPESESDSLSATTSENGYTIDQDEKLAEQDVLEGLAVVGFSLKFPQDASSPEKFWSMLTEGRCASTPFPSDRMNIDAFYNSGGDRQGTLPLRGGHFIDEPLGAFDAPFFSVTPAEAAALDPQQRMLLETAYRALENAGISMDSVLGSNTSVHTGCFTADYTALAAKDPENMSKYSAIGVAATMLPNRISWFFDLKGNSVQMDSACSSSLVALDAACQGLWNKTASMAIVGGCNLIYAVDTTIGLANMSFLSPESRCFSFDHRGNGYARGEGIGIVVIKRLSDAIHNGDTIRAVIRATGSNQDGHTPGVTQPSKSSQATLIRKTYERAGLNLGTTRFFEAHGTGTAIGDPIEAAAIGSVFKDYRNPQEPLYIGAVKSNIGHLEGCSGIAGLIKAVMVLEKGMIPPNTNFETLNSRIDAEYFNLEFPLQCKVWPTQGLRRASVNSFGFGGTNSHVVLDDAYHYLRSRNIDGNHCSVPNPPLLGIHNGSCEAYLDCADIDLSMPPELVETGLSSSKVIVLSAADEKGLDRMIKTYSTHFANLSSSSSNSYTYMDNLSYTLDSRRSSLPWKSFAIARDIKGLTMSKPMLSKLDSKLGFVFTGQGAQWPRMGQELLTFPVFRNSILHAEHYLGTLGCQWRVSAEMLKSNIDSRINEPEFSQPLCTVLQVALIDLLRSLDVSPAVVVGHSSGEIAAAYSIGAISCLSAWRIAYYRGIVASKLALQPRGAMMSVGMSEVKSQAYLQAIKPRAGHLGITVSCINSPNNITLSGDPQDLSLLKTVLDEEKIFARKLQVNVAYHSPQMYEVAEQYRSLIGTIARGDFTTRNAIMISSVSGCRVSEETLRQSQYWIDNMINPVRFSEALQHVCQSTTRALRRKLDLSHLDEVHVNTLLELGPHSALQGPIRDILQSLNTANVQYYSALVRNRSAVDTLLEACGGLYCQGYPVSIGRINRPSSKTITKSAVLTDLPEYPFDHSQIYWHESRLSKGFRFRQHPLNPLLGSQVADWNPLEGRWQHILKASDMPWIDDHKIDGVILYPAAGMSVMALEAMRQTADRCDILAYEIEDAVFHSPLKLSSRPEGVETQFYLRPLRDTTNNNELWSEFRLCIFDDNQWVETCRGKVRVVYQSEHDPKEVDCGKEVREELEALRQTQENAIISCDKSRDVKSLYQGLQNMGYHYGPSFKPIVSLKYNETGEALGDVNLAHKSLGSCSDCVVHPTTLDGILQLSLAALTRGGTEVTSTSIPTRIGRMWISNKGLTPAMGHTVKAYSRLINKGSRGTESSICVLDSTGSFLRLRVEGFETTTIGASEVISQTSPVSRQLCYQLRWRPDVSLLSEEELIQYCAKDHNLEKDPVEFFRDLKTLRTRYIKSAWKDVEKIGHYTTPPYLQRYISWLEMQQSKIDAAQAMMSSLDLRILCARLEEHDKQGELAVRTGQSLSQVLRGEIDPLHLLFQDNLMKSYYQFVNERSSGFKKLGRYIDITAHKTPGMKILEIGAGTGATTEILLRYLSNQDENGSFAPRFSQYDFTDISSSFFEEAQEYFKDTRSINYSVLNIEEDPATQGFEEGSYDLIVAAHVLHATASLQNTVRNVRKLLKPGGKLILVEITEPDILGVGFTFGLLPGWWLGNEHFRQYSPCVSENKWNEILMENNFSGTDIVFPDYENHECHEWSIIVSTAQNTAPAPAPITSSHCLLLIDKNSYLQRYLVEALQEKVQLLGFGTCEISSLEEAAVSSSTHDATCIFLYELERPLLRTLEAPAFTALRSVLESAAKTLWVTNGGGSTPITADFGIFTGLQRVLRTESNRSQIVSLALDIMKSGPHEQLQIISKVLQHFVTTSSYDTYETEYVEKDNVLEVGRIFEDKDLDLRVFKSCSEKQMQVIPLGQATASKLSIGAPGLLDTLQFIEDDQQTRPLGPKEVELEVRAVGLNFRDILVSLGRLDSNAFGWECAGVVTRVGRDCSLQPGTRVSACYGDTFRTYARCPEECVLSIPDKLSFVDAASVPTTFTTVYHGLHEVARIQKGESILIHAGAGGTGQAAIQIAKLAGALVYVTVGSEEKKQLLMDLYGVPEEHILYSRNTSFAQGIKRLTCGKGVDIVLNSLSGESLMASWNCIAPWGRFIEIGKRDIQSRTKLPMLPFEHNVTFSAVDIAAMSIQKPALLRKSFSAVMDLIGDGKIGTAKPIRTYGISEIEKAFRLMQSGKHSGKIVIELNEEEEIPVVMRTRATYSFDPNVTYLIAGGLGGLGRSITRWMVSRGAKHLLLLSRSGTSRSEARDFVQTLKDEGVQIEAPACDITDAVSLEKALKLAQENMPSIKGCIQGSMVLKDSVFQTMTFADWKSSVEPKVQGTWNLHSLLPRGLDFFVLLSSVCGIIGQGGQANYAAGNTYQDAFVRYRLGKGEKAVSLNLGPMLSEGLLAENPELMDRFMRTRTLDGVTQQELFALLDQYCNPSTVSPPLSKCQVVTGIIAPANLVAQDIDIPAWMNAPMFNHLFQITSTEPSHSSDITHQILDLATAFSAAQSLSDAGNIVAQEFAKRLAKILFVAVEDLDLTKPVHTYGLDSLVAVELRNWFEKELKADVAIFEILGGATFLALGASAAGKSLYRQGRWTAVD